MHIDSTEMKKGGLSVDRLNGLDLFSGIGGISQSLSSWVRTIAYCEREPSAQRILLSRMYRGEIEQAPIWDDVTSLRGSMLPPIDIITGGFPCQDLSSAGLRKGLAGERSGLFFHIVRLAKETKAPILFLENVKGVSKFIPAIRSEIEILGYQCRDGFISASDVGARHQRERWFLLAYSHSFSKWQQSRRGSRSDWEDQVFSLGVMEEREASDSESVRSQENVRESIRHEKSKPFTCELLEGNNWDEYADFLLRMDHGLQHKGDAIRALGNGVVPSQVETAFTILMGGLR